MLAQVGILGALDDAEIELPLGTGLRQTDTRPAQGLLDAPRRIVGRGGIRDALVEKHRDVAAQDALDGHALLGPHEEAAASKAAASSPPAPRSSSRPPLPPSPAVSSDPAPRKKTPRKPQPATNTSPARNPRPPSSRRFSHVGAVERPNAEDGRERPFEREIGQTPNKALWPEGTKALPKHTRAYSTARRVPVP